jgi:HK97 gp10 family phage protein
MATTKDSGLQLDGDAELMAIFAELSAAPGRTVMKPSIGKALVPVAQQTRTNVKQNKRSGALSKAIGRKTGIKKGTDKAWGKVFAKSKPQIWNGKKINPAKYAHLLEFGTRHSRPFPFMRRAMSQRRGDILRILKTEGRMRMDKWAAKLRRKHPTRRRL